MTRTKIGRNQHPTRLVVRAALSLALMLFGPGAIPRTARALESGACVGDCSNDGEVTVDELVTMVNAALGSAPASACENGDADGSGDVDVAEVILAVNNTLNGCMAPPSPTPTPIPGALGTRHFVLNQAHSPFTAVLGQGFSLPLGGFQGQTNGHVEPGFLDLEAGIPDPATGIATVNVTRASEYLFVNAGVAGIVVCLKIDTPVTAAGAVACNGGYNFSIDLQVDHNIGKVGTDGFTAQQCEDMGGQLEGPNQICAAGTVGEVCAANSDCDTATGSGNGVCGLAPAMCSAPPAHVGMACQSDSTCDTDATSADGVCGTPGAHPGVCNGPFTPLIDTGDSGAGALTMAPIPQFGLQGLPAHISIESALPCGDEGEGLVTPFALTSTQAVTTIFDFSNVAGQTLTYTTDGQNFSCADWSNPSAPGCLVLAAPALDLNPNGGDIVTSFKFCGR